MSFQDKPKVRSISTKLVSSETKEEARSSLLVNSSFSIGKGQRCVSKQTTQQVLSKISQTIISLHSTLVSKTQNIEIYRDLSDQEQKMLKIVQDDNLMHTILAGVLAIDSCLKHINRQETDLVKSLMRGVTICLGNYKKVEQQLSRRGELPQSFIKFYDSLRLIVSEIHKMPAAKIRINQIKNQSYLICENEMNTQLLNALNRQQNMLFSSLAQQNDSLKRALGQLQKDIKKIQKQKQNFVKSFSNLGLSQMKKCDSGNNITQSCSQSVKISQDQTLFRQLSEELMQKSDIIIKMNNEFSSQMQKYQKVFKRLQEQNKILKKYNDLDTAYILQELQFEVYKLKEQKKNDQNIINQIWSKMDRMSWNKNEMESSHYDYESYSKGLRPKYQTHFNPTNRIAQPKIYEMRRSRCPSVLPTSKPQNATDRYFSPNFDIRDKNTRTLHQNLKSYERYEPINKRDNSPRFGNAIQQKTYENIKDRNLRGNFRKQQYPLQIMKRKGQYTEQIVEARIPRSQFGNIKTSVMGQYEFELNKLKKQMRRSKFLKQQVCYM